MKICFVSSSGGHWEELMCIREISKEYQSFFVTEEGGQAEESKLNNIFSLPQINRFEKDFLRKFVRLFITAWEILAKERPNVVITTGALIAFPFCLIGKVRGAKIVYIESFARVNERSLTGRLVYSFADLFIVQWESLLRCYPRALYVGGIF